MHPQKPESWVTTLSVRRHFSFVYSEDQMLSRMRTKLLILPAGQMSEQASSLDSQTKRKQFLVEKEVEYCTRGDGGQSRNFLCCPKRTVDKNWPDDINGIETDQQNAERYAEARQRGQRYNDCSLKKPRPRYLHRRAQECLMENTNATWNDYSTRKIQRIVSSLISSKFLIDEQQTKAQMATRLELKEIRVIALQGISRSVDRNQKRRENPVQFWNFCRMNGHSLSCCRKNIRDEKFKYIGNKKTAGSKVIFTQVYNWKRGPSHG